MMTDPVARLRQEMDAAAEALDFEKARRLRDQISLIGGGATPSDVERGDVSGLTRQRPGAMGLGTSQQRVTPPEGWKPPRKPDPLTRGSGSRGRRKIP